MLKGINDLMSTVNTCQSVSSQLTPSTSTPITTTITKTYNSPQLPNIPGIGKRPGPYSIQTRPKFVGQGEQPLDLSMKSVRNRIVEQLEPAVFASTSASTSTSALISTSASTSTSREDQTPSVSFADKFLSLPDREREFTYMEMMAMAEYRKIPRKYTGENISIEMRVVGEAYLMGIPILDPRVIKDITEKTLLTMENLEPAVLHFSNAYKARRASTLAQNLLPPTLK